VSTCARAEVIQVDPLEPAVAPQVGQQVRNRLTGAHGGDQEDRPSRGQVPEQGQRGGVELGHVIGDGHQAAATMALVQGLTGLFEERHRVDLPVGAELSWPFREQGDHRAERQQRGRPAARHAFSRMTARRRLPGALIGQPGLPDPGPSVDHQAEPLARAKSPLEHLKLRPPAHDRPAWQRHDHTGQNARPHRCRPLPVTGNPAPLPGQAVTTAGRSPATIPTM
jgi:hypothetical protein